MIIAVIVSVTTLAVVAFVIGFVCGQSAGKSQARVAAFNQCIDWAALAMKGSQTWRRLSVADALLKAGTLIGGNDVMPPAPQPRVGSRASFTCGSAALQKGNQA